jgi:hypothetical protein
VCSEYLILIEMGRLNKKLTLKSKKAGKSQLTPAKVEATEIKVPAFNQLFGNHPVQTAVSKPSVEDATTKTLKASESLPVPKKLSKITKKEKRKLKSDGLKNKLTQLAKEKQEAKGIKVQ